MTLILGTIFMNCLDIALLELGFLYWHRVPLACIFCHTGYYTLCQTLTILETTSTSLICKIRFGVSYMSRDAVSQVFKGHYLINSETLALLYKMGQKYRYQWTGNISNCLIGRSNLSSIYLCWALFNNSPAAEIHLIWRQAFFLWVVGHLPRVRRTLQICSHQNDPC